MKPTETGPSGVARNCQRIVPTFLVPISYPDGRLRKMGVHMRAELPPGQHLSMEALRVVAFRTRMDHLFGGGGVRTTSHDDTESYGETYQANTGKFGELVRRLVLEDVEWVDDSYAFVIREK